MKRGVHGEFPDLHYVSQKRGVELFAITSLTVNRFWKLFYC